MVRYVDAASGCSFPDKGVEVSVDMTTVLRDAGPADLLSAVNLARDADNLYIANMSLDAVARISLDPLIAFARGRGCSDPEGVANLVISDFTARLDTLQFEAEQQVWAYLYTVARSKAAADLRSKSCELPVGLSDELDRPDDHNAMESITTQMVIDEVMGQLTEEQAAVLELRFLSDMPISEVADRMGRSVTGVKALQRRALRAAARLLAAAAIVAAILYPVRQLVRSNDITTINPAEEEEAPPTPTPGPGLERLDGLETDGGVGGQLDNEDERSSGPFGGGRSESSESVRAAFVGAGGEVSSSGQLDGATPEPTPTTSASTTSSPKASDALSTTTTTAATTSSTSSNTSTTSVVRPSSSVAPATAPPATPAETVLAVTETPRCPDDSTLAERPGLPAVFLVANNSSQTITVHRIKSDGTRGIGDRIWSGWTGTVASTLGSNVVFVDESGECIGAQKFNLPAQLFTVSPDLTVG